MVWIHHKIDSTESGKKTTKHSQQTNNNEDTETTTTESEPSVTDTQSHILNMKT